MIRTNARVPKLGRHASGQAVVRLGGKDFYLGRFGTPDAQAQYDTLIAEWLSRGRTLPQAQDAELSVNELVLAYLRQHVESHYRKNGKATSEQSLIKSAHRVLKDAYGLAPVSQFGPLALKVVRQRMIESKLCRRVVNKNSFAACKRRAYSVIRRSESLSTLRVACPTEVTLTTMVRDVSQRSSNPVRLD